MHFFIVTPSFNQLAYLKRCVASIRDQAPVSASVEHWVIDGGSTDGTEEWLRAEGISHICEPDKGMYDALNKGLAKLRQCPREEVVFAWLNCDEQYLPGALNAVAEFAKAHPIADIVCGDALVVNPDGSLITFWKSMPLRSIYLADGTLYNLTCAMFFRARLFRELGFDEKYIALADVVLVKALMEKKGRAVTMPRYVSTYTYARENISNQLAALNERRQFTAQYASPIRWAARAARALERCCRAVGRERFPLAYEMYVSGDAERIHMRSSAVPRSWPKGEP